MFLCYNGDMVNAPGLLKIFTDRIANLQRSLDCKRFSEIVELELAVKELTLFLHKLHNRIAPVHQLPVEILFNIFDMTYDSDNTDNAFSISQVCQRWRLIALSYAPMWTNIVIPNSRGPDIHACCLARSRGALLSVTIHVPEPLEQKHSYRCVALSSIINTILRPLLLVNDHSERIWSIDIELPVRMDSMVLNHLPRIVPNLVNFKCSFTFYEEYGEDSVLPDFIFRGSVPRLQKLNLVNVDDFSSIMGSFVGLTSLTLASNAGAIMSQETLMDSLRHCSNLQHLHVEGYVLLLDQYQNQNPPVTLCLLTHVSLIASSSLPVLSCIDAPSLLQLTIELPIPGLGHLMDGLVPIELQRLGFLHSLTSISLSDHHNFRVMNFIGVDEAVSGSRVTVNRTDRQISEPSNFVTTALQLFHRLSLGKVKDLTIHRGCQSSATYEEISEELMRNIFANMPLLQKFAVLDYSWNNMLQPLVNINNGVLLCPQLEKLTVYIMPESYQDIFDLILTILVSRTFIGRKFAVAAFSIGGEMDPTPSWEKLCMEHDIESFEDQATARYLLYLASQAERFP